MTVMQILEIAIIVLALFAGILNIIYFVNNKNAKRFYVLSKGLISIYLSFLYIVDYIDTFIMDIVPGEDAERIIYKRTAIFCLVLLLLSDAWLRKRLDLKG